MKEEVEDDDGERKREYYGSSDSRMSEWHEESK